MRKLLYQISTMGRRVQGILEAMGKTDGFKIDPELVKLTNRLIEAVDNKNTVVGARCAELALPWAKKSLTNFLRNSVVDKMVDGKLVGKAPFNMDLKRCVNYPEDIYMMVREKHQELVVAVTEDTGFNFERRVACYNALKEAVKKADAEAERRKRYAKVLSKEGMRPGRNIPSGNLEIARRQHSHAIQSQRRTAGQTAPV